MSNPPKPAFLKGILWILFSGTATVCAFLLPVHIYAIEKGHAQISDIGFRVYLFILISCALFHSLYRIKSFSLKLGAITTLIFFASELLAFYVFILVSF